MQYGFTWNGSTIPLLSVTGGTNIYYPNTNTYYPNTVPLEEYRELGRELGEQFDRVIRGHFDSEVKVSPPSNPVLVKPKRMLRCIK
jgi:hypothetical protein